MKPVTQADLARRYGYLLDHLARRGLLDRAAAAGAGVTPEAVESLIAEGRSRWRSVTLAQTVYKLRRMSEIIAPDRDVSWLEEIERDLALDAHPKPRFDRIVTSEQLVEAGLTLVREARDAHHRRRLWRAVQMRDGLMIALLALCPIRRKNFAGLTLQQSFRREGDTWWIVLAGRRHEERTAGRASGAAELKQAIALYLTWARPILLGRASSRSARRWVRGGIPFLHGALWVGEKGEALSMSGVERAITSTTRLVLGVGLSPHDFRRCAATTAAYRAGTMPNLASALLQHKDRRVTDEHYTRASSLQAG
jgi:integrase